MASQIVLQKTHLYMYMFYMCFNYHSIYIRVQRFHTQLSPGKPFYYICCNRKFWKFAGCGALIIRYSSGISWLNGVYIRSALQGVFRNKIKIQLLHKIDVSFRSWTNGKAKLCFGYSFTIAFMLFTHIGIHGINHPLRWQSYINCTTLP